MFCEGRNGADREVPVCFVRGGTGRYGTLKVKPRSSLCTHAFHRMDVKDPDIYALMGECWQQKHTQHAPSRRWNVTTSVVGLKRVTYAKISPKMVKPRDIAGTAEEEEW